MSVRGGCPRRWRAGGGRRSLTCWPRASGRWREIADEIGQSVANTSITCGRWPGAGLVATHAGTDPIFYRLASDRVGELWAAMRDVAAEHVAGLEQLARAYLGQP